MHTSYKDREIIFHIDPGSAGAALEKAYLKPFDGATVKFVSNDEGDKLVIDLSQQRLE